MNETRLTKEEEKIAIMIAEVVRKMTPKQKIAFKGASYALLGIGDILGVGNKSR